MNISRIARISKVVFTKKSSVALGKVAKYSKASIQPLLDIKDEYKVVSKENGHIKGGVAAVKKAGFFGSLCSGSMCLLGSFSPLPPGTGLIAAGLGLKLGMKLDKVFLKFLNKAYKYMPK